MSTCQRCGRLLKIYDPHDVIDRNVFCLYCGFKMRQLIKERQEKETKGEKMKPLFYYLALLAIFVSMSMEAKAEYIDLSTGKIVWESQPCRFENQVRGCMLIKKDGKYYQMVFDKTGEYKIFQVEVVDKDGTLIVVKPILLWVRGAI